MAHTRIALIGPSGAGKSTLGRLLAQHLGWTFIDLDTYIETQTGTSIPVLFASEGEHGFRDRESAALEQVLHHERLVLACGGGVVLRQTNRQLLRDHAWCVFLTGSIATLAERIANDCANPRPLLDAALAQRLAVMLDERLPLYASIANWTLHTDQFDVPTLTDELVRVWQRIQPPANQVRVHGGHYQIVVAGLTQLPRLLREHGLRGAAWLISDDQVGPLYAATVRATLDAAGYTGAMHLIAAGEPSKSLDSASALYGWLLAGGVQRGDVVVALGGGVVGDLAGFVAATILRGIAVVQVPTTILAMIDSSIGGKTGVNHPRGKNLIGAFHQPRLVLIDPAVLTTLPARERAAGWAEAVKHGVIADADLFEQLEAAAPTINDLPTDVLSELLLQAAAVKIGIVNRDERERGERMLLNYGHTLGQAIEAATGYTRYLHGEAVAIGMTFAAELAVRRGLWSADAAQRQHRVLQALQLPTELPADVDREQLITALLLDKKRANAQLRWVLPTAIGQAQVVDDVPLDDVIALLDELIAPEPQP